MWRLNNNQPAEEDGGSSQNALQFQQAQKPAWLSSSHYLTCACFVSNVLKSASPSGNNNNRVLVGTNRGFVLVYDFDENVLLSEISADPEQKSISMLSCAVSHGVSSYPMVIMGVDTAMKKVTLNETQQRAEPPVDSKDPQLFNPKPIQLDGPIKMVTEKKS